MDCGGDGSIVGDAVPHAFIDTSLNAVIEAAFDGSINLSVNCFFGDGGDVGVDLCDGLWYSCCEYVGYQVIRHMIEAC